MPGENPDSSASQQGRDCGWPMRDDFNSAVGGGAVFRQTWPDGTDPATLAELIESDPALTVLVLRLCHKKGIVIKQRDYWMLQVMEGLSLREIRDAVLSAKIYGGLSDDPGTISEKNLPGIRWRWRAVPKLLAKFVTPAIDGHTAYLAGLLHDIGKFLLDEAMPKSFDTLLEQARAGKTSFCKVEQENLGLDHTILGKAICTEAATAERYHFGNLASSQS